jgi:DNA-binding NarL/FixJ family response regulator
MNDVACPVRVRPINLVLVNISAMAADLLRFVFAGEETIRLVGSAATATQFETLLNDRCPDVALVGSGGLRQESNALPFLEQIRSLCSTLRPIVMSEDMSREDVVSFFRHGARGLICKSQTDVSLLMKCIQCVGVGEVWASSEQLELLIHSLSHPGSLKVINAMGDSLLSQREEQVLQLLADGLSNRGLAKALKLSEHTVKNHLFRIFDKLGVSNRMEAVLYAVSRREQCPPGARAYSNPGRAPLPTHRTDIGPVIPARTQQICTAPGSSESRALPGDSSTPGATEGSCRREIRLT